MSKPRRFILTASKYALYQNRDKQKPTCNRCKVWLDEGEEVVSRLGQADGRRVLYCIHCAEKVGII